MKSPNSTNPFCVAKGLLIIFMLTLSSLFASAIIIEIPTDYLTIQEGLDIAQAGDTVHVNPGTYYENLNWPSVDSIKLISKGDTTNTILVSDIGIANVKFSSMFPYSSETMISGFRLENLNTSSSNSGVAAISIGSYSNPTIENIYIYNYTFGGGCDMHGLISISYNSSPTIRNCKISKVSALDVGSVDGGAIYLRGNCNPIISNVIIENFTVNASSSINGGAIYIYDNSNPVLDNIIIRNMEMTTPYWNFGAGIYISDNSDPICNNIQISQIRMHNSSWNYGGGVYIDSESNPIFNNLGINDVYVDNAVRVYGGGIYVRDYCSPIFTNTTIENLDLNSINYFHGGAISITDSCNNAKFESLTIRNVYGSSVDVLQGLGIYIESSSPELKSVVIHSGMGTSGKFCEGGGIYIKSGSNPLISEFLICDMYMQDTIYNYSDRTTGGGVSMGYDCSPVLVNGLITDNGLLGNSSNSFGAGVYIASSSTPVFTNCTVADNTTSDAVEGTGVYAKFDSHPIFKNCIIRNPNTGDEIDMDENSSVTISYSNIRSGFSGVGNIDEDPLFYSENSYVLTPESPSFGTGTSLEAPSIDINGNPRPANGNSNPSMGAYEDILTPFLGNDTIICGDTYILEAGSAGSFSWSPLTITADGQYEVEAYFGCYSHSDIIQLSFVENPIVNLGDDTIVCGNIVVLDAGPGMGSYYWNNGSEEQTIDVSVEGFYSVTVTNMGGCVAQDDIFVSSCDMIALKKTYDIEIFPNPAKSYFVVNLESGHNVKLIRFYNSIGAMLEERRVDTNNNKIDFSTKNIGKGIYFIHVYDNTGSLIVKKVVVN